MYMYGACAASRGPLTSRLRTSFENPLAQLVLYIHIPLLGLPKYYASNASIVLERAAVCKTDYNLWVVAVGKTENDPISPGSLQLNTQDLPSIHTFSSKRLSRIASYSQDPQSYLLGDPAHVSALPPVPKSVLALQDAWVKYIDTCISEWRMLTVVASVLFTCVSYSFFRVRL